MNALLQDLRYALRSLSRAPGFTVASVVTLALGIGANAALFSVVNGVLLKPLPYADSERIVQIFRSDAKAGRSGVAPADVLDWKDRLTSLTNVTGVSTISVTLNGEGEPERVVGAKVSASLFPLLGIPPSSGQFFGPDEDRPGAPKTVVLTDGLWQRRFGGQTTLLGKTILLNGEPHVVAAVMPASFHFVGADLLLPLALGPSDRSARNTTYLRAYGRLAPGISIKAAQAEMDLLMVGTSRDFHQDPPLAAVLVPWREASVGEFRPAFLALGAAVAIVLLIACANVAHLLLARGAARQREFAIRAALGAGPLRLVRQLLTESALLAAAGSALGLLLATWSLAAFRAADPNLPRMPEVGIQLPVFLFTLVVAIAVTVLFGLFPAFHAARDLPAEGLKEGGRATASRERRTARALLVGFETALAILLVVGAGLFLKSLARLSGVALGFEPSNVLTYRVALPQSRYPDRARQADFFRRLLERTAVVPGVKLAAAGSSIPLSLGMGSTGLLVAGRSRDTGSEGVAQYGVVSADYFGVLGIPVQEGRAFTALDGPGAPDVAVVNQALARRYFPDRSPVGQRISLNDPGDWREIVGVVGDVRSQGLDQEARPTVYVPYGQNASKLFARTASLMTIVLKSSVDPSSLTSAVRRAAAEVDPTQPIHGVMTLQQLRDLSLSQPKLRTGLLTGFAALAILLACIGIYGVVAHGVGERRHEIGIRLALGALPRDVVRLIAWQGMIPVLLGAVVGVLGAAALTRFLSSFLFGVNALDGSVFVATVALLVVMAGAACVLPALPATRVDPAIALRGE